jgi:hypothetical protein
MWQIKYFRTLETQKKWIEKHERTHQITVLFVNNGWAVEYKKLRTI